MIKGLYTAALGMTVQMKRMDVVTNNIANSDTAGFKRDIPVTQSFSALLERRLDDYAGSSRIHDKPVGNVSPGLFVDSVYTDFSTGTLRSTGGPFELAISGDGFFCVNVKTDNGDTTEKYTRDGSFTLTADRTLVTKDGFPVLGEKGAVKLPEGEVSISKNGEIYVNGEMIDTLKLVDVENKESLRKAGNSLYDITDDSKLKGFKGEVVQGYLENSNTNSVREMVDMIALSRVYEANSKVVSAMDANLGRAVNEIARK